MIDIFDIIKNGMDLVRDQPERPLIVGPEMARRMQEITGDPVPPYGSILASDAVDGAVYHGETD